MTREKLYRSPHGEGDLLGHLKPGRENIQSSYTLAYDVGCSQRQIGFMVRQLRLDGHAVGSVPSKGYYLIETEEELAETKAHILSRHKGLNETVKALESAWHMRSDR